MRTTTVILLLGTTTTALIAGLFYAYSCSVNPGLARLTDKGYLEAMKSINRAILNPVFFISFLGTLLLLPASTVLTYGYSRECFTLLFAASAVYFAGVFGVTMFGNVPLNNALERFNIAGASPADITAARAGFEASWNRLHTVRTAFSVVSLVLAIMACIKYHGK